MNLEWLKKHKGAAIAGGIGLLLVLYLLFRNSASSSSGLSSAISAQNQGQLQLAQANAQLNAQSEQTQAELAASEYSTQAQEKESQNQEVGDLVGTLLPEQFQTGLEGQELEAEEAEQSNLIPLEGEALDISKMGNRATTGQNELALLLGEGGSVFAPTPSPSTGVSLSIPGLANLGLFGL